MKLPYNVRALQGGKRREVVARFAFAEDAVQYMAGLLIGTDPAVFYENRLVFDDMDIARESADVGVAKIQQVLDSAKPL